MTYKEYLEQQQREQPKYMTIEQASKLIGKSQQWVRIAMQRKIINIGYCIKNGEKWDYYINPTLLYKFIGKEPFRFKIFP